MIGTDEYDTSWEGNHARASYERETIGGGTWTRTGTNAGDGTNGYTLELSGDEIAGHFSASTIGTNRYDLVERFSDISNTEPGVTTPGNVSFHSHGLPFRDPVGEPIELAVTDALLRERLTPREYTILMHPKLGLWARLSSAGQKKLNSILNSPELLSRVPIDPAAATAEEAWTKMSPAVRADHQAYHLANLVAEYEERKWKIPRKSYLGVDPGPILTPGEEMARNGQALGFFAEKVLEWAGVEWLGEKLGIDWDEMKDQAWAREVREFLGWNLGYGEDIDDSFGEPEGWESFVPLWGEFRYALHDYKNGRWFSGLYHTVMAATDLFLVKGLLSAGGKLLLKKAAREGIRRGGDDAAEMLARGAMQNAQVPGAAARGAARAAAIELEMAIQRACFVAGTPLLTPEGAKVIEEFRPGDLVLSREETNPSGPVEAKVVEEVFVRVGPVMRLVVSGHGIGTTAEHPFHIEGIGWRCAAELRPGDSLSSHNGVCGVVEVVEDTGEVATVYNMRVAEYHTYFVGSPEWGFSVWVHNKNPARSRAFRMEHDPSRRVLGPARKSHADEIAEMQRIMEADGVQIVTRKGAMAYAPNPRAGRPGQFIIDPDASYTAWRHEFRHYLDDKAGKWQGWSALSDKNTRWAWEQRAYAEEISYMRRLGHDDVVEELIKLQTREWRNIYMPHLRGE